MGIGEFNAGGNPAMDWHPIQGGVEIFLVASCHGNRDKLRPSDMPLGSYAVFTFTLLDCSALNHATHIHDHCKMMTILHLISISVSI